jgi:predicted DNA-binding transcriptional regulator AlpA
VRSTTFSQPSAAASQIENTLLLTEKQTAERLALSVRTLQGWRVSGGGPPFVKMGGRCVRYRARDIERWLEERLRASTSDSGRAGQGVRP